MNADGTLSPRELEKLVPTPTGERFREIEGLDPATLLQVGDLLRVVAYNDPSWPDSLWDSAQENAEEHVDQVVGVFADAGVTVILAQVAGVIVADVPGDERECYVYDVEIVGFTTPPQGVMLAAFDYRGAAALVFAFATLLGVGAVVAFSIFPIKPGPIVKTAANTVFWISLAVIAVSIAVIVKSAKAATP